MSEIDLSIITVGFKSREFVRELLNSLFAARGNLSIEYFIIDNASDDGLIDMVQKEFVPRADERLQIFPIQNSANLGFAKANNIGIKQSRGRYVLLLNPDMRLFTDSLTKLVEWMDNNIDAGIAGGKLVDAGGALVRHVRRFPTVADQLVLLLKLPHVFPHILDRYVATDFDYTAEAKVDSIRGSFFAIRRSVIEKIGGLDERYFIWFEEVDYCKEAHKHGFSVWYTPEFVCTDFVGRSFSLVGGYRRQSYFTESMVKYFSKWHPRHAWMFKILRPIALAAAWVAEKIQT